MTAVHLEQIVPPTSPVTLRELQPGEDATPFRLLNEEWITRFFTLEPRDRQVLSEATSTSPTSMAAL